jgi:hypothetical protein
MISAGELLEQLQRRLPVRSPAPAPEVAITEQPQVNLSHQFANSIIRSSAAQDATETSMTGFEAEIASQEERLFPTDGKLFPPERHQSEMAERIQQLSQQMEETKALNQKSSTAEPQRQRTDGYSPHAHGSSGYPPSSWRPPQSTPTLLKNGRLATGGVSFMSANAVQNRAPVGGN